MSVDEPLASAPRRHHVEPGRVRLRVPDAVPDESMFFLLALVAGGLIGYLVALG